VRVIAGSAKGRRLGPVPDGVRPLSDRAREGLFASLGDRVRGARVLDLFAGTGAIGIEALSRGADSATFIDSNRAATRAIAENLSRTGFGAEVITKDCTLYLRAAVGSAYELVFVDPPYATPAPEVEAVLGELTKGHLEQGWIVCLTRPKRDPTLVVPLHWAVARRLSYGDSLVVLYQEEPWA
jgi:16S rRNA (guanine966-N2)-methyltransferase